MSIEAAQRFMVESRIDGWLTRDYRYSNPIFEQVLRSRVEHLTRPVWLIIPSRDEPRLLSHSVDAGRFPPSGPKIEVYANRREMVTALEKVVQLCRPTASGSIRLAMDYSPMYELPRVGRVDAGTVELARSFGAEVVPSGDVIQYASERWSPEQLESHHFAADATTRIVREAFRFVGENVRWQLTEHDVAEFIRGKFRQAGMTFNEGPVVAFNAHSSDPHYDPKPSSAATIRRRGWLLIDLWAARESKTESGEPAIYADITWVASLGGPPEPEHQRVFEAVRAGRDAAFELIERAWNTGKRLEGWEVDRAARQVIGKAGYGEFFVHRLGHSLGAEVHSNGVNLDDWETHDTRSLIEGVGVTIEPGVYLPGFGVRSEMDVYTSANGPIITTPPQEEPLVIDTA